MISVPSIKIITLLSLAIAFGAYGLEAVTYPGMLSNNLGVNSLVLLLPALVLFCFLRLKKQIPTSWTKILFFASQTVLYLGVGLYALDQILHSNFVFSTFGVYPFTIIKIGVYLSLFAFIALNFKYIKQIRNLFLILLPIWAFALMFALKLHSETIFYEINKEDSLVEYATMVGYLVITLFGYKSLRILLKSKSLNKYIKWLYCGIYVIVIIGSFLVAGEEISWGERIIGFQAPQSVTEKNTQSEFNIHNNFAIFGYVYYAYSLVALYGIVAFLVHKVFKHFFPNKFITRLLYFFAPPPYLITFFIPMFIYSILYIYLTLAELFEIHYIFNRWEEFTELILASGLAAFFYRNYKLLQKNKKSLHKVL